ncbi:class I SAM-dependent methyltransferase [Streptomyces kunmingensis]|uniref:Class I SAM-dependent methyltransferase n=1 Tax=Streptomyces kunmingensis TaxID=68225 RepID=A0ABU6CBW4_9ACTN|nr:class I SAM-dependent methyltransferase [Streptomyces kunmingensis]MEB3961686.1 class I SAM-dependent methyltransferase [Streptomyces kunmingensis]
MSNPAVSAAASVADPTLAPGLDVFSRGWPDHACDTVCGWGSSEPHTQLVRKGLQTILDTYHVRTVNDAGCGDLAWMSTMDLEGIDYIGYDVHERATWPQLRQRGYRLEVVDITGDELRPADLLVCRDVFIHLPNDMILRALEHFRRSARYLLTTTFRSDPTVAEDTFSNTARLAEPSLRHAKLDLTLAPFGLGRPLELIPETFPNKYLGLWDLAR